MVSTPTVGENSYVTNAEADTYFGDSVNGAFWEGLEEDDQNRALLSAARLLEKQCWIGTKTDPDQDMKWPRTGVVDSEGNPIDPNTIPYEMRNGQMELALLLAQDPTLEGSVSTSSNLKRAKAGSAEVEFFGGTKLGTIYRFPAIVWEWVGQFSCGFRSSTRVIATGVCKHSQFDDEDFEDLTGPI